ncbi:MAG: hypothetical protein AB4372_06440 [Xenococcus sp. (in: cyanobacteria)]
MANSSTIKVSIHFNDPNLEAEEKDEQVRQLIAELREMEEIDSVNRVPDLNLPENSRALGGFLVDWLMAEVISVANAKKLLGYLRFRLRDKPIEIVVEGNGKKLKVKAYSQEELEVAIQSAIDAAQNFIAV